MAQHWHDAFVKARANLPLCDIAVCPCPIRSFATEMRFPRYIRFAPDSDPGSDVTGCIERAISGSRISSPPEFIDEYCDQHIYRLVASTPSGGSRLSMMIAALTLLPYGERIEIDKLRIVWMGIAVKLSAAMNVHQGLHAPSI
jgi:hypothetical protein